MCIRDRWRVDAPPGETNLHLVIRDSGFVLVKSDDGAEAWRTLQDHYACLLYTSDAADERSSVDLGGRRIIKKKKHSEHIVCPSIAISNCT